MSEAQQPITRSTGPAHPKDWVEPKSVYVCRSCGSKLFFLGMEDGKAKYLSCVACLKAVGLRDSAG